MSENLLAINDKIVFIHQWIWFLLVKDITLCETKHLPHIEIGIITLIHHLCLHRLHVNGAHTHHIVFTHSGNDLSQLAIDIDECTLVDAYRLHHSAFLRLLIDQSTVFHKHIAKADIIHFAIVEHHRNRLEVSKQCHLRTSSAWSLRHHHHLGKDKKYQGIKSSHN